MRWTVSLVTLSACAALVACGGAAGSSSVGSGGASSSSAQSSAATGGAGGASGDGSDDFDHAIPIQLGDPIASHGALEKPGDRDYFAFTAGAGQWLRVFTTGNPWNDPARINTAIRLYDASRTLVAENDDTLAPPGLDAEILTRLPAAGTYFIEVLEHADLAGESPRGGPDFSYGLVAVPVDPAKGGVVIDPEQGDDAVSAAPTVVDIPTAAYDYGEILGGFDHASDVDVYSFAIDEAGFVDELVVLPGGPHGDGATAAPGRLWVTDSAAAAIHARIGGAGAPLTLSLVGLDQGLLWVERPAGAPGANDFYVAKLLSRPPDHAYEAEDPAAPGANDTTAGAEPLTLVDEGGARTARWFTRLSTAADVDQYAFPAQAGETLALQAASASVGAGVIGLHVQILSETSEVLAEGVETAAAAIDLVATVKAAGTVYVRLDKSGQDLEIESDYVDSALSVTP